MADWGEAFVNWRRWSAFKIPVIGVIVLSLLLLVGPIANVQEAGFTQKVVLWILGATVIAYGHDLAHSTQRNRQGIDQFKDLTPRTQAMFMVLHVLWFAAFVYAALAL